MAVNPKSLKNLNKIKKGEVKNPHGRPKKLPELREIIANVLGEEKDGKTAVEIILQAQRIKAARGDVRAAEFLFDRGYGKAKQNLDVTSGGEPLQPPTWFDGKKL